MTDSTTEVPVAGPSAAASHTLPEPQRRRWLRGLVLAQLLFVLAVAGAGYATEQLGTTITLRTAPADPRDLRFHDYLELRYLISELPGHLWKGRTMPRRKDPVYVVLELRQGTYEAIAVYPEQPAVAAGQTVLRGWVQETWRRSMRLRYGLERYYLPEEARRQFRRPQPLQVTVSIAPWGQARISQVAVLPALPR
ncbi:GDYXXLXY domain-containing protein [Hymenobacter puniceus]|uniref:GDYXXLXY domain-containing protein n=1 Tax=Hymenobacter sp. BT190 TaxID=2763505 RepID=UPI0016518A33|nr:GDYXXLXY domain-containing protein [Hymenobacter sp. BT190]MBC6697388.1 GDYXXLXY domain-containing protein [Hymenobacter sp. BT190]